MKRFRIYTQQGARFSKLSGRFKFLAYTINIPVCGYDDYDEAFKHANSVKCMENWSSNDNAPQICILDFNERGKIVSIL